MSRRQRRKQEEPQADDDDDEPSGSGSRDNDDPSEAPSDEVPARPQRLSLMQRLRNRGSRSESLQSSISAASAASYGTNTSGPACRAARQIPDHRPSTVARLLAWVRSLLFDESDGYFQSRFQVASSTTLQMMLYFNLFYAIVFAVLSQAMYAWKVSIWSPPLICELVTPMIFYLWVFIEATRLGLGYFGNLSERVPWLVAFWMLTLFPQPLIQMYFFVVQDAAGWFVTPMEVVLSLIFEMLYVMELAVAYRTSKRLVAKAAADFHLQPLDSADESARGL